MLLYNHRNNKYFAIIFFTCTAVKRIKSDDTVQLSKKSRHCYSLIQALWIKIRAKALFRLCKAV